jgi:peroxiredoxin
MSDPTPVYNSPDFQITRTDSSRLGDTMPVRVGQMAPEFEAALLDGGTFRLAEQRDRAHVVLMMGSITSPMCAFNVPPLNALHAEYGSCGVQFYLVYTNESHPGEAYPHHTSFEQKQQHSRDLQRLENVQCPILVDDLEGTIHRGYGQWPTSLFVVHRDGRLVYRSPTANATELSFFLRELIEGEEQAAAHPDRFFHVGYTEWLLKHEADEPVHYRVYERAGPKAFEDTYKLFPGLRGRWPRPPA